eukprot:scaffold7085_cov21-Tisochrysis_lutea.AAC.1
MAGAWEHTRGQAKKAPPLTPTRFIKELRDLGGLAAACLPQNYYRGVVLNQVQQMAPVLGHRQPVSIPARRERKSMKGDGASVPQNRAMALGLAGKK